MALQTVHPYGQAIVNVPYGQKIAISTNGGDYTTIYYETAGSFPPAWYVHDRIKDEEVLLGTFAASQNVKIETKANPALYSVDVSPTVSLGDATTLMGYAPSASDTADTVALRTAAANLVANILQSTVATGTAPLIVASTTNVANLNADTVDGIQGASLLRSDAADSASELITLSKSVDNTADWWSNSSAQLLLSNATAGAAAVLKMVGQTGIARLVYGSGAVTDELIISSRQSEATAGETVAFDNNGNVAIGNGLTIAGATAETIYPSQGAPNAQTTDATLTAANIATKIITVNQGAAGTSTLTLPLATAMDSGFPNVADDHCVEFSVINISTNAAEDCTIATNTGWTLVGSVVIESYDNDRARSTGRFCARKTGTGAWTLYRIA